MPAGNHTVRLDNVASNCVSDGNPRGVTVLAGGTTSVTFAVTCLETGGVRVTATTTGADWDPDGYYVQLQSTAGGWPYGWLSVPPNGATTFTQVRAGTTPSR